MVHGLEIVEAQALGEFASIDPVTLVALFEQWQFARIAHQDLGYMRFEQVVEPGCPGAFFEGHEQAAAQSREELQKGRGFGFQDGFHDDLALEIHHRDRNRCLMNVEPNILFTAHRGCSFRR